MEELLAFAEINVNSQYGVINILAKRGGVELPLDHLDEVVEQPKKATNIMKFVRIFETPLIDLPYPTVLDLVLENDVVLSNISLIARENLYDIQYSLKRERAFISDEKASYTTRFHAFREYLKNLRRLDTVISNEIKYMNGEVTLKEYMESYRNAEIKIAGLSRGEYEYMLNDYLQGEEAMEPSK